MNKQEYYREQYKKIKPDWKNCLEIFIALTSENVNIKSKVLDIGCGHADFLKNILKKTEYTYGLDPDENALKKNKVITNKTIGSADKLPYQDNYFDVIILVFVMEHLENPKKVFKEIYRTLKTGGKVIFLTPNIWNYNVWLIKLIPNIFHNFLAKKLYNRQDKDTYRKKYKINSPKKVEKALSSIGFKKEKLILNGDPPYISFNNFIFRSACFLEKITDNKYLKFTKVHIIGIYRK